MKYKKLIEKMTLEDKASLCIGKGMWYTNEIKSLDIPSVMMSDGPNGLRIEKSNEREGDLETPESKVAVCFPTEATIANSWDRELIYNVGKTIGKEALSEGVDILLGPGVNIKRSPLCGRNFEYLSEDPYLAGKMGASYVNGVQETGIGVCVKHFAANNQEYNRRLIDVVIDERALREIYLKAFEIIVKEANPCSIMSAYNKVNGKYCSDNKELLDILKEWNFNGIVITDWGAETDRIEGLKAGTSIAMPGNRFGIKEQIIEAVNTGKLEENILDEIVNKILCTVFKLSQNDKRKSYSKEEDHNMALKAAEESVVLLKNSDNILPIKNRKIALIGDFAINPRYQGAGSSKVNSYKIENAYDCFKELGYNIEFAQGYERQISNISEELLHEAIEVAKRSDVVLIFAGLTEIEEAEGLDRSGLDIAQQQNNLIEEISKINTNVIVVLSNGSPIAMPWKDKVKGIITGYLGGEAGARAIVNCLIGNVNPSGKLAETYPLKIEDTPCYENFPGSDVIVPYKESIYIGYRYYDKINKEVLFPFGFGLSYTKFEYSNLEIEQDNTNIKLNFKIKNVGDVKGKEIAEIYISYEGNDVFRPRKELKGFEKVELEVGEEKDIIISLNDDDFKYYSIDKKRWLVKSGIYRILVGKSSKEIVLEDTIKILGENEDDLSEVPECYKTGNIKNVLDNDFETILRRKVPSKMLKNDEISDSNSIEQIRETKVGKYIYDKEMERVKKYFEMQNVDKAYRIVSRIQKPLRRFYEKENSIITKEMVDELISVAKSNKEKYDLNFIKIYFDDLR